MRPLQAVCSLQCSIVKGQSTSAKQMRAKAATERKERKAAKEKSKTLTDWLDDAQRYVNRYVVLRDGKVCISCGTQRPDIQYCGGHFRSRGAASHLRFNLDNIHTQCNANCNMFKSGNIANYRPALIAKIGIDRVDALENDNQSHKWTIDEAKEVIKEFKLKLKQLTGTHADSCGNKE